MRFPFDRHAPSCAPEGRGGHHGFGHGFGGRGFGGSFGGGRSRLGRLFAHGDLRLVVLGLIAEKPRHGYEIIKAIEDQVAGAYSPSPGVVYPTLTLLEELGQITTTPAEGGKKLHSITPEGQAFLDANREELAGLQARMSAAAEHAGGALDPRVTRALENFRMALHLRLSAGRLDEAQATALAAALDAAAAAVERVK
jgi:DNA-binding PadR family transcriptional regulator